MTYARQPASAADTGNSINYATDADALGSSRIITNSTGSVCYDSDYYPFGIEQA